MPRRKTHEEFIEEIEFKNSNIEILGKYINNRTHLLCKCITCNHEWLRAPGNLLNHPYCPICKPNTNKKYNMDEFKEKLFVINLDVKVLSTEYKNNQTKILVKCNKDDYEWWSKPNSLLSGYGCPKCGGNAKKTHEEFLNELFNINPNIEVLEKYQNINTKILCRCKIDGYEWKVTPNNLISNKCGCPKCAGNLKKTHDDFVQELYSKNQNFNILGKYINNHTKIKTECKICGHIWDCIPVELLKKEKCPQCSLKHRVDMSRSNLEEFKQKLFKINPDIEVLSDIYVNNRTKILVRCKKDGYEWQARPNDLLSGYGCALCSNRIVIKGINDIATTHPHLILYFNNKEDAYKYTAHSNKKVYFKCPDCGSRKMYHIQNVTDGRFVCDNCGDGVSYPNKFCRSFLRQLGVKYIAEYNPEWIKPKKYDNYFEINGNKYILEADGGFHTKEEYFGITHKETKAKDDYKDKMAIKHGIKVIRINCEKSDKDYIANNIINSELSQLFDLSVIDWDKCDLDAHSNYMKMVCEAFNNYDGNMVNDFAKTIDYVSKSTVRIYLINGTKLGLCNYNSDLGKKEWKEKISNKITVYDLDDNLLYNFESATKAKKVLTEIYNILYDNGEIAKACKGIKFTDHIYKGLKFRFTDEKITTP